MPSLGSFQGYLDAAVKLKTALIKAKPGRQEWEQAPPFMRCTAAATDDVQRARAGGFSVQSSAALELKDQGNELIHKDPAAALDRYTRAISVFLWFDRGPDRASEDVPLVCAADQLTGSEQHQAYHLLAVAFSNAAACLLQLDMAADAAYACSKALKYDPYNVKALYRRAMAYRQASTTAGLEAAVGDLMAANQLEPANNQVRVALTAVQNELRELRRQERGMYGNIFRRGGLYDETDAGGAAATAAAAAAAPGPVPGGDGVGGSRAAQMRRRGQGVGAASVPASSSSAGRPPGGGEDSGTDDERPGDEAAPELDPEDLLFTDPAARKAESALASREADLVMRKMQAALARSRTRRMAERLDEERARRAARFPWWAVPWWAYLLIGLHLAYRLVKVWRVPVASDASSLAGGSPAAGPSEHGGQVEL